MLNLYTFPLHLQVEILKMKGKLLKKAEFYRPNDLESHKPAAVLVPLVWLNTEWNLLFTRRTNVVQYHKGQVSFPGGMAEGAENDARVTALREANEEINLNPEDVLILGFLPNFATITNYCITPVVGVINHLLSLQPHTIEVETIFTIPLKFLADKNNSYIQNRVFDSNEKVPVLYYKEYAGELLWGITAQITQELLKNIQ